MINGVGCHGVCKKYRALRQPDGRRYEHGQKRCKICSIFINWDGIRCPCCSNKLRVQTKDPHSKYRAGVARI